MKSTSLHIRLSEDLIARIDTLRKNFSGEALGVEVTRTQVVRYLLLKGLKVLDPGRKPPVLPFAKDTE